MKSTLMPSYQLKDSSVGLRLVMVGGCWGIFSVVKVMEYSLSSRLPARSWAFLLIWTVYRVW